MASQVISTHGVLLLLPEGLSQLFSEPGKPQRGVGLPCRAARVTVLNVSLPTQTVHVPYLSSAGLGLLLSIRCLCEKDIKDPLTPEGQKSLTPGCKTWHGLASAPDTLG